MAVIITIPSSTQTNIMKDTEVICLKARDTEKTADARRVKATETLAESSEIQKIIAAGRESEAEAVDLADLAEKLADARRFWATTFGSG